MGNPEIQNGTSKMAAINNDKITSLCGPQRNIFGGTILIAQESCIALIVAVLWG